MTENAKRRIVVRHAVFWAVALLLSAGTRAIFDTFASSQKSVELFANIPILLCFLGSHLELAKSLGGRPGEEGGPAA